jgi:hypothetical protein
MKMYYQLKATRLPKNHRLNHEKDEAIIGERGRLCLNGEPKLFRSEQEASCFVADFLKRNGPEFELEIQTTSGPINCRTGRPLAEDSLVDHNYYLKVVTMPEAAFTSRENIRPLYLRGDLVVGKGGTSAKKGRQLWFQTHENAQAHLDKLKMSPAFQGYLFEIITVK